MSDKIQTRKNPIAAIPPAQSTFPHERLDAYRLARQVVAFIAARRQKLHGMPGELRSQIERSSVSAMLNTAEGAARPWAKDRAARFEVARAETCEAAAAADGIRLFGGFSEAEASELRALLCRLAQTLTRLARPAR